MNLKLPNSATQARPKMAQIVSEAAALLHTHYSEGIPVSMLKREIERIGGYGRDSVIPSDYCYNVINKAPYSCRHPVLVRVERGRYKYVGPDYAYTGPILWKPKQESERQVGRWNHGVCHLEQDPRE